MTTDKDKRECCKLCATDTSDCKKAFTFCPCHDYKEPALEREGFPRGKSDYELRNKPYEVPIEAPHQESWEEEFSDKFDHYFDKLTYGKTAKRDMIAFIASERSRVESLIERLRRAETSTVHTRDIIQVSTTELVLEQNRSYNAALDSVLSILRRKE